MKPTDERELFARLILALGPYRSDVVLIGGWAHRLFRLHPLSQLVDFPPLLTQDVDLAVTAGVAPREEDLRQLLLKAGFVERLLGEHRPPVTHYQFGDEGGFYAEFLAPLAGGGVRRDGAPDSTTRIAGVSAQKLRYLETLLVAPWAVSLSQPEYPVGSKPRRVRIANATSYLAQKLLVLPRRRRSDREKDVLYLHDALIMFGRSLSQLQQIWTESVSRSLHPAAIQRLRKAPQNLFSQVTDFTRGAARVARNAGRPLTPDEMTEVCRAGLTRVFA